MGILDVPPLRDGDPSQPTLRSLGTGAQQAAAGNDSRFSGGGVSDSAVVHKTGNETIAGVKTFTSAPVVPSAAFPESAVANLTTDLVATEKTAHKGAASGYMGLDGSARGAQSPKLHASEHATDGVDALTYSLTGTDAAKPSAGSYNNGLFYFATDTKATYRSNGSTWVQTMAPSANYVQEWQPFTFYAGNTVVAHAGQLYSAITDFTSGASFNSANWNGASGGVTSVNGDVGVVALTSDDVGSLWASGGGKSTIVSPTLVTSPSTTTVDFSTANVAKLSLNRNVLLAFSGLTSGRACMVLLRLIQNGTGGFAVTFPAGTWRGLSGAPTFNTAPGNVEEVMIYTEDGGTTVEYFYVGSDGVVITAVTSSKTLAAADANTLQRTDSTSAVVLTVPPHSSVPMPVGTVVLIIQKNTGQTSVAAGGGVTINFRSGLGLKTAGQHARCSLIQGEQDVWNFAGDISA